MIEYNTAGNAIIAKDNDQETVFAYDNIGQLINTTMSGNAIKYTYDTELNLTSITNEHDEKYLFEVDANGKVIVETGFDGLSKSYKRNGIGQVAEIKRPNGKSNSYTYNSMGELTAINYYDGSKVIFNYSLGGKMLNANNNESNINFEYDAMGNTRSETTERSVVDSVYDIVGMRIQITSSLGANMVLNRNNMGDVLHMAANGWLADFVRTKEGWETNRVLPGNINEIWTLDNLGQPITHQLHNGNNMTTNFDKNYTWGINNRLLQVENFLNEQKIIYQYDNQKHLTGAWHSDDQSLESRFFDNVGNIFANANQKDHSYGAGGRLLQKNDTTYTYDDEGNRSGKIDKNGEAWKYFWNAAGMLAKVVRPDGNEVTFGYDALGRRIWKKYKATITKWVWDGSKPLHEWKEFDAKESDVNDLITWIFDENNFTPIAKLKGNKKYSIINNHIGTPIQGYDEQGTLVWERELDICGNTKMLKGEEGFCNYLYQGQVMDKETGLAYNRFRYYSPDEGIYLSQDPIGLEGGFALYGYVGDSNKWIDVFGWTCSSDAKILRANLIAAGDIEPAYENCAHHIVKSNDPQTNALRLHLALHNINVNDADNGVFLPRSSAVKAANNVTAYAHSKLHTNYYITHVNARLINLTSETAIRTELLNIKMAILNGTFKIQP